MQSIGRDLRYALRVLARAPVFTATVVGVLALGIAANVALFGVVHAALIRALPFAEPDGLVVGEKVFQGERSGLVFLGVSVIACRLPARTAMRIDPAISPKSY